MRITYNDELNKLINPYLESLLKNKTSLDPETAALFDLFMEDMDMGSRYGIFSEKLAPRLEKIIHEENIKNIANLADGKLNKLFRYMLGEEFTHLFHTYLQLEARCPHTFGCSRRSQRSVDPSSHLEHVREAWSQFLKLRATEYNDTDILKGGTTPKEIEAFNGYMNSAFWLAAQIEQRNESIIESLKDLLKNENNNHRLQRWHLHAIAISGDQALLKLEGELLLTPKLQEGIRQSIVETMDEGAPESFLYLFSVIYDNGLQRFASVKRNIAICTGLGEQDSNERVTDEYIGMIKNFLTQPELALNAVGSENTAELYLALWSIGFYDTHNIRALIPGIIKNGAKHQVQTLLYFQRCTQSSQLNHIISKDIFEKWHDDPEVVAAVLPLYMDNLYLSRYNDDKGNPPLDYYFESKEEALRQYQYLKQVYLSISDKETYSPHVFPWDNIVLTRAGIVLKMAYVAWVTNDSSLKDDVCNYLFNLEAYNRASYIAAALARPDTQIQQEYVLQSFCDRSVDVRDEAYKVLSEMNLSPEQYRSIEEMLRFKYGEMRINAIHLLMKQPVGQLAVSIRRLLTDKVAERRLAGLDMMKTIHNVEALQDIYRELLVSVKEMKSPSAKEKILIESLIGDGAEETVTNDYTKENGFGLYDPALEVSLPPVAPTHGFNVKKVFEFIRLGKAKATFEKLNKYIERYKDEEFRDNSGEIRQVGSSVLLSWYKHYDGLSELGLPQLWQAFYEHEIGSFDRLLMMKFMLAPIYAPNDPDSKNDRELDEMGEANMEAQRNSANNFEALVGKMYAGVTYQGLKKSVRKLTYYRQIEDIIDSLLEEYWNETYYQQLSANMLMQLLPLLNTENVYRQYSINNAWLADKQEYGKKEIACPIYYNRAVQFWLRVPKHPMDDALFTRYFTVRYELYKLTNYMEHTPQPDETYSYLHSMDFARAWMLGLIPSEEVYRELMGRIDSPTRIKDITTALNAGYLPDNEADVYADLSCVNSPLFRTLVKKVVDRILEIELKRGDSETQVTRLAEALQYFEGAETLVRLLQAFGKDTFARDIFSCHGTKRGVLSSLLRACFPSPTDTGELLRELAQRAEISDERLVEAAMFAPQWLELTEQATHWVGLVSAAYYFHAHTCENFDDKKKAIIARYTPIAVEDLQEGAFDIDWFRDTYKIIGKERFEVVYNAAKYISQSNSHARARKLADAVSGKIKVAEIKKEITAKRSKDSLMRYGLIPLGQKADKELLDRYQFFRKFLKESKELGTQKHENEKRAVNIALQNLARNAGYENVTRLTWNMETELLKKNTPYFAPKTVEGVEVYVQVNANGRSDIKLMKDGKEQTKLSVKLRKHPYVDELKEVHSKLTELYTRSRIMLEQAMEDRILFEESELRKLMKHPVIWPLLKHLVFISDGNTGFYTDGLLITADNICLPLSPNDKLRIAHPVDLYASDIRHAYQKLLFDKAIRQPFRQVFRELYLPTPEENEDRMSTRYSGNKLQQKRVIAALKERRWVADFADGLQKIYYKDNIIASIYAPADWFSANKSKVPTLEYVSFHNRIDYRPIMIAEIPPIIFSEVMRDVDMAVEAGYDGVGKMPEVSQSTLEIRRVMVELTASLLHISHVKVIGDFAVVENKKGKYNIHLSDGEIAKVGGLPVMLPPINERCSEELFLHFAEQDIMLKEILTAILFLADDENLDQG